MGETHGLGDFRKHPGHPIPEPASPTASQLRIGSAILPSGRALKHSWSQSIISVTQSCLTLCDPTDCSTPAFPIHHQLPEPAQTHGHWVGDSIQPFHPQSPPSPPTFNLSQHQGLFQGVSSLHQVAEVLEFQLQHQSFQWTPRTDLL